MDHELVNLGPPEVATWSPRSVSAGFASRGPRALRGKDMADRIDFYFRQRVTEAELDLALALLEKASVKSQLAQLLCFLNTQ